MRVWRKAGRQWVGCVGHHIILVVFGIFVAMDERVRARLYYYGGNRLPKGCVPHTFRVSALTTAKTHSPEVLSSVCSHGLGLEHGRFAQRSLRLQKEMSCVL